MPGSPALSPIVELRQYTLRPGRRDTLIEMFDRAFIEPQEAVGARVIGQFRDLDRPDRFVWLRGFADMERRRAALEAFYGGPVWAENRAAANDTMIDTDDVLLLRPVRPGAGFRLDPRRRPPIGAKAAASGMILAVVLPLKAPADARLIHDAETALPIVFAGARPHPLADFVTDPSPNSFPRLPVRTDVTVFVWFAAVREALTITSAWSARLPTSIQDRLGGAPQLLRLSPTARSLLRA